MLLEVDTLRLKLVYKRVGKMRCLDIITPRRSRHYTYHQERRTVSYSKEKRDAKT